MQYCRGQKAVPPPPVMTMQPPYSGAPGTRRQAVDQPQSQHLRESSTIGTCCVILGKRLPSLGLRIPSPQSSRCHLPRESSGSQGLCWGHPALPLCAARQRNWGQDWRMRPQTRATALNPCLYVQSFIIRVNPMGGWMFGQNDSVCVCKGVPG